MDVNHARALALLALLCSPIFSPSWAQEMTAPEPSGPSKPAPRMADGHPDFSGYWKGQRGMVPGGNIAKDLPGLKLPLTPAGEAAWQHNVTATVIPKLSASPAASRATTPADCPSRSCKAPRRWHFFTGTATIA